MPCVSTAGPVVVWGAAACWRILKASEEPEPRTADDCLMYSTSGRRMTCCFGGRRNHDLRVRVQALLYLPYSGVTRRSSILLQKASMNNETRGCFLLQR